MAFEDRYYKSTTYGLVNLRYRPADPSKMPTAAVFDAKNTPGYFCLAKVRTKYDINLKFCYSAEKFSEMKPVLLRELNVSIAYVERDIDKLSKRVGPMNAQDIAAAEKKDYTVDSTVLLNAQREALEMTDAITYWTYEDGLCNHVALAA